MSTRKTRKGNTDDRIGIVVNCKKLRIRAMPDISSTILGFLGEYEEVKIKSDANDEFYKLSGKTGYVMKEFIRLKQLPYKGA